MYRFTSFPVFTVYLIQETKQVLPSSSPFLSLPLSSSLSLSLPPSDDPCLSVSSVFLSIPLPVILPPHPRNVCLSLSARSLSLSLSLSSSLFPSLLLFLLILSLSVFSFTCQRYISEQDLNHHDSDGLLQNRPFLKEGSTLSTR
jgi:hypothetical protein